MNAEQLLTHFDRIADAPDAIPRLRRFILDLAVRGKLVPQYPNDEPASELLKRIAAEKARLVKSGEIRKQKITELTPPNDLAFELPSGWVAAKFSDVLAELRTGPFGSSLHQNDYEIGGTPVINPASMQDGRIVPVEKMAVGTSTLERLAIFKLQAGDIVMGRRGEMGRCAVVTEQEDGWLCGTGSLILRLPQCLYPKYLAMLIGSPYVREYLGGSAVGATMQNLNQSILLKISIGLPPFTEQHRIVAKINELMALCDRLEAARTERENTRNRLTAASLTRLNAPDPDPATFQNHATFALSNLTPLTTRPAQIKALRQTILNLAVRGKLVEQDPIDEHVAKRYAGEPISDELPTNYRLLNFGKYCDIEGGNQPPKSQFVNEPRKGYVQLLQIRDLGEHPVPTYIPIGSTNRFCREGEILIGRYGASIGKIFWAKNGAYNVAIAKFIWPEDAFISTFAFLILKSKYLQGPLANATRSAQAGFNKRDLAIINFPLPPLAEQHRIVAKVDELMALCDRLEASLATGDETRGRLVEAVLYEALRTDGNC